MLLLVYCTFLLSLCELIFCLFLGLGESSLCAVSSITIMRGSRKFYQTGYKLDSVFLVN